MNQNITQKEIAPGIILQKLILNQANKLIYCFKVQVNKLNIVEFIADFSGSENIILEGQESLKTTTIINSFETQEVARLHMNYDWKLKTKFKFTLKPTSKEIQLKYISDDLDKLNYEIEQQPKTYGKDVNDIIKQLVGKQYIDLSFKPNDQSIYIDEKLDTLIQWRRPSEFYHQKDVNKKPEIFFEKIEPIDIRQGALGNTWFLSAIATIAERPALIRRLFVTPTVNTSGIYRLKLCKNGEWIFVTIDDLFPCYPQWTPIFSQNHGNELWILLLEKAYAKVHGKYYALKKGLSHEALIDLTGCPTERILFDDFKIKQQGIQLFKQLKKYDEDGYLVNAFIGDSNEIQNEEQVGLVNGQTYTLLQVREVKGIQLLNLRNPWGNFEWKGDWADTSSLWTQEMKNEVNFVNDSNDGQFWMCLRDFLIYFNGCNVCKVRNWDEVRIKGKFLTVQDSDDANLEIVMSKWYYTLNIAAPTKVIIGVHQEDQRCQGVLQLRPYLDIGVCLLKKSDKKFTLVAMNQCQQDRQIGLECDLQPGLYAIVPRTSGLGMKIFKPSNEILNPSNPMLISTLKDIFRKFDMLLMRELSFIEFKGFSDCIERSIGPQEYKQIMLSYPSTDKGLTQDGFIEWFLDQLEVESEDTIWQWLERLGYDRGLHSIKNRCFIMTVHSSLEVSVTVRDALSTDLDNQCHVFACTTQTINNQIEFIKFDHEGVRGVQSYNRNTQIYTVIAVNDQTYPVDITVDYSMSTGLIYSTKGLIIKKRLVSGQMEFLLHYQLSQQEQSKVIVKAKWQPA